MRDDVVARFSDSYWEGLSAPPERAGYLDECREIIATLVDAALSVAAHPDAAPDAAVHGDRFDEAAQRIIGLLDQSPHVWTVGLLQRAAVDVIVQLVEEVAACRGAELSSVLATTSSPPGARWRPAARPSPELPPDAPPAAASAGAGPATAARRGRALSRPRVDTAGDGDVGRHCAGRTLRRLCSLRSDVTTRHRRHGKDVRCRRCAFVRARRHWSSRERIPQEDR